MPYPPSFRSVSQGGLGTHDSGTPPSDDGGGTDAHPPADAHVGDGGCIENPLPRSTCSAGEEACIAGNECCIGYVLVCMGGVWTEQGVGCACKLDAGGPDVVMLPDGGGGEIPTNHRPNDDQCATSPAPGTCNEMTGGGAMCSADTDCTAGTNGRCVESTGGALFCSCTYDTCSTDSDCMTGDLCVCHGSAYTGGEGNTCLPGNCRVDSDCGANGYCSPSEGSGDCGGISGYYCHTSSDTCVNDSDCTQQGADVCEWSATDSRWECTMQLLCG
jgi:hypothetical protein